MVWASSDLLKFLGAPLPSRVLGRRPGEALGCVHASESALGCGSSEACYRCAAVASILESKRQDRPVARRGTIEVGQSRGPRVLDWEFTATPWVLGDFRYTVLTFR